MEPLLPWLNAQIKDLKDTDYVSPSGKIDETETIIGEMTDLQKQLYTVWSSHEDAIRQQMEDIMTELGISSPNLSGIGIVAALIAVPADNIEKFEDRLDQLRPQVKRIDILQKIFWEDVRRVTPAEGKEIGVRKGFQIVTIEDEGEQPDDSCSCSACQLQRHVAATMSS